MELSQYRHNLRPSTAMTEPIDKPFDQDVRHIPLAEPEREALSR